MSEKPKKLKERLQQRHEATFKEFKEHILTLNNEVDQTQLERLSVLKNDLLKSHNETKTILEKEKRAEQDHLQVLKAHETLCAGAESDVSVLPELVDVFHKEKDSQHDQSAYRAEQERFRLLHVAVKLRTQYQQRLDSIEECAHALEAEEGGRREKIQELLRQLMLNFAKISYTGVTNSHVLAQQVIHNVNAQLVENFLGIQTLLSQLSKREILAQRQYSGQIADLYHELLQRIVKSQITWIYSRLRSSLFRRPNARIEAVEKVAGLSATVQRNANTFLSSIGVVVASLRTSAPGPQYCGGSTSSGWLRHYDPDLQHPVFAGSPQQVVEEWIMKANVLTRNSLTQCLALSDEVRQKEKELLAEVQVLKQFLLWCIEATNTPLEREVELWQESSLTASDIDEYFRPFVSKNMADLSHYQAEAERAVGPVMGDIALEGEWFANTVRDGLQGSHVFFEEALVLSAQSILRVFEGSTKELTETATGVLGFLRAFYRGQMEAANDSADAIAKLEEQFMLVTQRLGHAGSVTSSEELFAEGLHYLDKIAKAYSKHHKNTIRSLESVKDEAAENYEKCTQELKRLIGLEEKSETERRLERERMEKIQEAYQHLIEEQNATNNNNSKSAKKDSKASSGGERSESTSITLSMVEESIPLEEPHYPQVVAADGTVFNIITTFLLNAPSAEASAASDTPKQLGRKGSKRTASNTAELKRTNSAGKKKVSAEVASPTKDREVSEKFQQVYLPLLSDTVRGSENFVTSDELNEWMLTLRVELAQWLRSLQKHSSEELNSYCANRKEEMDKKTNEILREHRRRPARFQADSFESRVRELENTSNTFEKHCTRLLERAAKINSTWCSLHSNQSWKGDDEQIIRELNSLKEKASEANTAASLQVQERRYVALTSQFMNHFKNRCKELKLSIEKQKDSLEAECRVYLDDRAKQLSADSEANGTGDMNPIIEADPLTIRVKQILRQLEQTVEGIEAQAQREGEERQRMVDEYRAEYDAIYKQNNAELILLTTVQECLARVKAQVQSAIQYSNTSEEKLNEIVSKLEQSIQKAVPQVSLAKTVKVRLQRDYALETSSKPAVDELTSEMIEEETDAMEEKLGMEKIQLLRNIKSGDTANVLSILDTLREHLYVRGGALNALLNSVQMVQISPDFYVEPKPLPKEAYDTTTTSSKGRKNAKPVKANTAVVVFDPLPPTTSIESTYRKWADEVRNEIKNAANSHFATYPPPLNRRLQGMQGGQLSDLLTLTDTLCEQQEKRVNDHVADALRRYHQQVQRVNIAVQSMPQYITATVHAITVNAVEKRVGIVLESFGELYSYSAALKTIHQGELKVSLGQQVHRDKLEELSEVESKRQMLSKQFIQQYWGYILRELQDESGLHSVRCACTVNTFFGLLKGIVTPFHLVPIEGDLAVGQHRGLKHLMRMREREKQLKEIEVVTEHQEYHLQETMPLMKQETNRKVSKAGGGGAPLLSQKDVDYDGLPLNELRPLEEFNAEHTESAIVPLPSSHTYYVFQDGPPPSQSTSVPASRKGGKKERTTSEANTSVAYTPPFSAPNTNLHQETIALARESVSALLAAVREVVDCTGKVFSEWQDREEQWKENWSLMVARLTGGTAGGTATSNNNGTADRSHSGTGGSQQKRGKE